MKASVTLLILTLLVMRSQTSSRSDDAHRVPLFKPFFFFSSFVSVGLLVCVHGGLALSHHQRGTDFAPCDVSGGPYLRAPSRSARVRNRFAFVVLGVICPPIARGKFKPELEFQAGTSSFHARTIYDNIGYVDLPEDHMYNTRYV